MPKVVFEHRNRNWLSVIADDEAAFEASASMIRQTGVKSGQILSDAEYEIFYNACTEQIARKKAVTLLSRQNMSKKSLCRKLGGGQQAEQVTDEMEQAGYINDEQYALGRAEVLICRRLHSPRRTEYELIHEGLSPENVKNAILELDFDVIENIKQLVQSRYRSKLSNPDGYKKVACALLRAGYNSSDIRMALGTQTDFECEDVFLDWESE